MASVGGGGTRRGEKLLRPKVLVNEDDDEEMKGEANIPGAGEGRRPSSGTGGANVATAAGGRGVEGKGEREGRREIVELAEAAEVKLAPIPAPAPDPTKSLPGLLSDAAAIVPAPVLPLPDIRCAEEEEDDTKGGVEAIAADAEVGTRGGGVTPAMPKSLCCSRSNRRT